MYKRLFLILWVVFYLCFNNVNAQNPPPSPTTTPPESAEKEEILRIDSSLVQTSVTVLDKKGKFVTGLSKDDFEVSVDKKNVKVEYFDAVTESISSLKSKSQSAQTEEITSDKYPEFGRNIVFYVDDHHLTQQGTKRVYDFITKFVRNEMNSADQLMIVSPTNRIGFLQQFSNDRQMILSALKRIIFNPSASSTDITPPSMTSYEALLIDRNDADVINIFFEEMKKITPDISREQAVRILKTRSRQLLTQDLVYSTSSLQNLVRSLGYTQQIPGRKIFFFLSEGFFIDHRNSHNSDYLRSITDAALRSNSVIYSFDVKGLDNGTMEMTTTSLSRTGVGLRVQSGERGALLDALANMAGSTGGKLFANNNDISQQVFEALDDASGYYVLAWEPHEDQLNSIFRNIEVSVKNRPELTVRFQKGYLAEKETKVGETKSSQNDQSAKSNDLDKALYSPNSESSFPIHLLLDYAELSGNGSTVNAGIQIPYKYLQSLKEETKTSIKIKAEVFDDKGIRLADYDKNFDVNYKNDSLNNNNSANLTYNIKLNPKPGFYQIRVAAQDLKSGKIGNVNKWIEVPDLNSDLPALSSLILNNVDDSGETLRNADGRYLKKGNLRYLLFIYQSLNQRSQLSRELLSVNTKIYYQKKNIVNEESAPQQDEAGNFFFGAELPMNSLNSGRYEIEITVTNKKNKKTSTRWATFEVY